MKKNILTIICLFTGIPALLACDFCNCYLGLNPQYKKNTIGLRYKFMSMEGSHMPVSMMEDLQLADSDFREFRTAYELHGQWYPVQKVQILYSLPYWISREKVSERALAAMQGSSHHHHGGAGEDHGHSNQTIKGIGDPLLLAHYQLFNRSAMDSGTFSHRLFAGGGIKLPAGHYKIETDADPLERLHQPGSGSFDFMASMVYLVKWNRTGLNMNANYLFTTENKDHFQMGNRLNANATFYYDINLKRATMYPNMGLYLEQSGRCRDETYYLSNTGGWIMYGHAGFDVFLKQVSLTAAVELPAVQKLNRPQPEMKFRVIAGLTYSIN